MLIVVTKDQKIIDWVERPDLGGQNWGTINKLTPNNNDTPNATIQLINFLTQVRSDEPLCISGHGNDEEIGDEDENGWSWGFNDIGDLFGNHLPGDYRGSIFMNVCCNSIEDFSTRVVLRLEQLRRLRGVSIYGYNRGVVIGNQIPAPDKLDKNVEIYAKVVNYR